MKKPYAIRLMIVLAQAMLTNAAAYAQAAPTRPKQTTTQNKPAAPKPQPVHSNNTPVQKPTVTTYNVSGVKSDMARCGGSVNSSGGSSVTAYGVCWSTSPHPTRNDYKTVDGSGVDEFNSTMTNLQAGTTYYVRAYATNSEGTAYGKEVTFTTEENHEDQLCPVTPTVKDYDGNTYRTVQIGSQCWMAENLRTTHYADGTSIPQGCSTSETTGYWYYPDGNSGNKRSYGLLYNWPAVMRNASSSSSNPSGVQGICPKGWHVPSDAEWTQLENYVGSQPKYRCNDDMENIAKALASTSGWKSDTDPCTVGNGQSSNNATGFNAVPAGGYNGSYGLFGYDAYFWSATQDYSGNAYHRNLNYGNAYVYRYYASRSRGFSVRCLRD